jgi:phosphatidylglycerol lysyltransferase
MVRPSLAQRVMASLVALMALVNIASALLVHDIARSRLVHDLLPMLISSASRSLALVAGFCLLILARGLWRGKRAAWLLTLGLLLLSAVLHLTKGLDWEEAASGLVLAGVLATQQRHFFRNSDPPTLRRLPSLVAIGIMLIVLYGLVGFWLLRVHFQPFAWSLALRELTADIVWSDGPYANVSHGRAGWFLDSLSLLSLTLMVGTLLLALRPVLPRPTARRDLRRASDLVRRYGTSSLAPFALDDDKLLYFGETVEGVVAYRVAGRVAVVCGDPIAAPADVGKLAAEFVAFCAHQDWQVCFYEVQPRHLRDYAPLGFKALKIGEDAWIELPRFTLKGSAISDIRHAVSKIARDGLIFHIFDPAHDAALWAQVQAIEAGWRASQQGFELGFSIGRLPAQPGPKTCYMFALAPDGQAVLAYCSFLAVPAINGLALDVMRRAPNVPNGTMEFLIARSLEHLRDQGYAWVSLGLAPLANVDAPKDSLIERGIRAIYTNPKVNAIYRYQSLFFFKKKFNPQWRGGYLLYPSLLTLPQVFAAIVQVHAPALEMQLIVEMLRERVEETLSSLRRRGQLASQSAT